MVDHCRPRCWGITGKQVGRTLCDRYLAPRPSLHNHTEQKEEATLKGDTWGAGWQPVC